MDDQHDSFTNSSLPADETLSNTSVEDMTSYISHCELYDFIVEGVLMGLLCIFGFCGNALSMICLSKDKSKTATPFLLVSLEAADTLFLFTVLVLRVISSICMYYKTYNTHFIWAYIGKFIYPFALITETGTIYVTLLVTLNRYVSVCKPYDASRMCSIPHARQHVFLVLAFAILYNIPRFFEYVIKICKHPKNINETILCNLPSDLAENTIYQNVYVNVSYFLIMFLFPLVLLIFLNAKLIKALRETKRRRAQLLSRDTNSRSEEDITLMLIVVVLVFVVCQTPALFTQVLGNMLSDDSKQCNTMYFYYERISDLFVVGNSSLNFIIYCFCSKKFREILKSLLCEPRVDSPPRRAPAGDTPHSGQYKAIPTNSHILLTENGNCTECSNEKLKIKDSENNQTDV